MKLLLCALALSVCGSPSAWSQVPSVDIHVVEIGRKGEATTFAAPRNATHRPGYDNQPCFLPDSRSFYFTSIHEDDQADIYRYDLGSEVTQRVTATRESEYSPTPLENGRFSTVRVEADSTQRLWSFAPDGSDPQLVLPEVTGVGYHAWGNANELILFVLGDPHELHRADRRTGKSVRVAVDIGRSLHRIPDQQAWSFTQRVGEDRWRVRTLDLASGAQEDLVDAPGPGSQDGAWTPWGALWMVHGNVLLEWSPGSASDGWEPLHDFGADGLKGITRLAVSPDGRWLALVAAEPEGAAQE